MTTNAKRYGLEVKDDIETENRLRRIETYVAQLLSVVDISTDASTSTQRVTNVPQVTGLRVLGKTPGAITLAWNQIRISDLRRYELDIAEDLAFSTNKQTYNVAGTEYQFSTVAAAGGGGATTIYARVRARSRSSVGPYSVTINTTTGQAQSADIASGAVTTEKISLTDPIEFDGLDDEDVGSKLSLRGYIDGLILSNNATDPNKSIDVSGGVIRDSTNVLSVSSTSTFTKEVTCGWEAGSGAYGLASSLLKRVANTWYFVFVLADATGETVDFGFDTDIDATNLLLDTVDSGLTLYRRIGAIKTDASNNIYAFTQYRDEVIWDVPKQDVALSNPGTDEVTHTLDFIPTGYEVLANVTFNFYNSINVGDNDRYYAYGGGNTVLPAATAAFNDIRIYGDQRGGAVHDKVLTNNLAQVKTRQSHSGASYVISIQVHGWVDLRGKDGTI